MLVRTEAFRTSVSAAPAPDAEFVAVRRTYVAGAAATTHNPTTFAVATTGPDRKLVVAVGSEHATGGVNDLVSSITYNGVAATGQAGPSVQHDPGVGNRVTIFYWDDDDLPTDGAVHQLTINMATSTEILAGAIEYRHVAQGDPSVVDANGATGVNSDPIQVDVAGTPAGGLALMAYVAGVNAAFSAWGANQVERVDINGIPLTASLGVSDIAPNAGGTLAMTGTINPSLASRNAAAGVAWAKGTGGGGGGGTFPTLGIAGADFTIDGTPTFLLGFSYFNGEFWYQSDLDQMAALGYNLMRTWGRWTNSGTSGIGFFQADGSWSPGMEAVLHELVDYCGSIGMIVELALMGNTFNTAPVRMIVAEAAATSLLGKPHVLFDVLNEHDHPNRAVSHTECGDLIAAIQAIDPSRICTVSSIAQDTYPAHLLTNDTTANATNIDAEIAAGVNCLAPHLNRTTDWWSLTAVRTRTLVAYLAGTTPMPVYLNEEERQIGGATPTKVHFMTAAQMAVDNGAGGWIFHNEAAFALISATMFDQFNAIELDTVDELPGATSVRMIASAAGTNYPAVVPINRAVPAGKTIVLMMSLRDNGQSASETVVSVSDTKGHTWSRTAFAASSTNSTKCQLWLVSDNQALTTSDTISVSVSSGAAGDGWAIQAFVVDDRDLVSPVDDISTNSVNSTTLSTGDVTTTVANTILFAAIAVSGGPGTITQDTDFLPGAEYALEGGAGSLDRVLIRGVRVLSSTETNGYTVTVTNTRNCGAVLVALKRAA